MRDVVVSPNHMIQFPITTGLTSRLMKTQETVYTNKNPITQGINFVNEVDNIKSLKIIRNILFFALNREDGSASGVI